MAGAVAAVAVPAANGGNDAFTTLLLHCNGSDTATTFLDASASGNAVTASGNAQIDTAQSKFDGASGLLDGSGDYLSLGNSAGWDFGTGDFTIDFWARSNGAVGVGSGLLTTVVGGVGWGLTFYDATTLLMGNNFGYVADTGGVWTVNSWHHIAIARSGSTLRMYFNGTSGFGFTYGSALNSSGSGLIIGRSQIDYNGDYFNGWIDEVRVSKGLARWTGASFTPPTAAYF